MNYDEMVSVQYDNGRNNYAYGGPLNEFEGDEDNNLGSLWSKLKKLRKKTTPKFVLKAERKITRNPKIMKVVTAVGAVVATVYGGPAAGQAVLALGKAHVTGVEMNNKARKIEAQNRTVEAVQEKIKELPVEKQMLIKRAYDEKGVAAFKEPEIKQLLDAPMQAGVKVLAQEVELDAGRPPNVATENAEKIAALTPQIVEENHDKIFGVEKKYLVMGAAGVLGLTILGLMMRGKK